MFKSALLAACTLLGPSTLFASASTFIVDASGSGDFVDLPQATLFAAPGDVLLVMPGSYSSFYLDKGVTMLGLAGAQVSGDSTIADIPAQQRVVLGDLQLLTLSVVDCQGVVALEGLEIGGFLTAPQALGIVDCRDVRVHDCLIEVNKRAVTSERTPSGPPTRVELSECSLRGGTELPAFHQLGGRAHLSSTNAKGGNGHNDFYACDIFGSGHAGEGAPGVHSVSAGMPSTTSIVIAGRVQHILEGGDGGDGGQCLCDGHSGPGALFEGSEARLSGVTVQLGHVFCPIPPGPTPIMGAVTVPSQADPVLELAGTPVAGQSIQFVIHGAPGGNVRLHLGRTPILVPVPSGRIEKLVSSERVFALNNLPVSGSITKNVLIPGNLPTGFTFWAQAEVVVNGQSYRTNSIPALIR